MGSAPVFSREKTRRKSDDVLLLSHPMGFLLHCYNITSVMIKFKTTFTFGFNLERKSQPNEEGKTISKVFMVAKEIVKKRLLKS